MSSDLAAQERMDHAHEQQHLARRDLDALFPPPSLPPSPLCPQRLPGISVESLAALQHVLRDNHARFHIFYNRLKFQNHITYRAISLYALGGSADAILSGYEEDCRDQRPAFASPGTITADTFLDHLGDENYYQAYVSFFDQEIAAKGISHTLEGYIFSDAYNLGSPRAGQGPPEMLSRFVAGLLHALIHVGYGFELRLRGLICEGLAMAAVHDLIGEDFFPPSFFAAVPSPCAAGEEVAPAANGTPVAGSGQARDTHALDVVALVLADPALRTRGGHRFAGELRGDVAKNGRRLHGHAARWTVDVARPREVERKIEELVWMVCVMYAVGGWRGPAQREHEEGRTQAEKESFVADFFVMHLVTSSLFLHALAAHLTPRAQTLLLRAYMLVVLSWWLVRAPPSLDIRSFMAMTPTSIGGESGSGATPTPDTPNPFLHILQTALVHPNDHLPKLQRALAHYSTLYGARPAGYVPGARQDGIGLADAELLDGSLFLRAAILTAGYMGWVCEGETPRRFSTGGFVDYV